MQIYINKRRASILCLLVAAASIWGGRTLYNKGRDSVLQSDNDKMLRNMDNFDNFVTLNDKFYEAVSKRSEQIEQSLQEQLDKKFGKGLIIELQKPIYRQTVYLDELGPSPFDTTPMIQNSLGNDPFEDILGDESVLFNVSVNGCWHPFASLRFKSGDVYPSYDHAMPDRNYPLSTTVDGQFEKIATYSIPARAAVNGKVTLRLEKAVSVEFLQPKITEFDIDVLREKTPTLAAARFVKWAAETESKNRGALLKSLYPQNSFNQ